MLRPHGKQCERDMLLATAGVNTHKGMLFSLALLCAAAGRLWQQGKILNQQTVCQQVARATEGLVQRELATITQPKTAGERFFHQHGLVVLSFSLWIDGLMDGQLQRMPGEQFARARQNIERAADTHRYDRKLQLIS